MAETIIPAKRDQRIWLLNNNVGNPWHLVDVIAWVVNGHDQPVPITPFGRFDTSANFVLGTDTGWMALPNGPFFRSSNEAEAYLRSRQ